MKQVIPETSPEYDRARVLERPNGFYWQSRETGREYGPFDTLLEAVRDMEASADEEAIEGGDTLGEAEAAIGIADWIDPDTGAPAEALDAVRLEDH